MSGEIPSELGSLSNLGVLHLSGNQLSGNIPTWLGRLPELTEVWLGDNQLSGEIPATLGSLSNLRVLELWGNQLSGEIPAELSGLSNLEILSLGINQLTGKLPLELGNLANLEILWLGGSNQLTGCIPEGLRDVPTGDIGELGLPFCGSSKEGGVMPHGQQGKGSPDPGHSPAKQYSSPPPMTIDPNKSYTATLELEKGGEIVIELFAKEAPITVNNFIFLARDGYYDGVTFHRVIASFMAQSGDPTGTGSGEPGYSIPDEFSPLRRHDGPGVLSMANVGRPNTGSGQWFITFVATPHLDDQHTVFGKVIEGMDVVNGITIRNPGTATTPGDVITSIIIEEGE